MKERVDRILMIRGFRDRNENVSFQNICEFREKG